MAAAEHFWARDWVVGVRAWVERQGRVFLGNGRQELLEAIERTHSITAAAQQTGMSYRRAWSLVRSMNEAAGAPLVEATTGGRHGGGAALTARGRAVLDTFRQIQDHLRQVASGFVPRLTGPAESKTVHVAAAMSLQEVLSELLADFARREPTISVRVVYGASDELAYQLLAGAHADLCLSASPAQLDRLDAAGLLCPGSRTIVAENSLAAIAPVGRLNAVRKPEDLARPEVQRIAVAAATSPLGAYTRSWLEGTGLGDLMSRAVVLDSAGSIWAALRSGQADVGLVYASAVVRGDGWRVLFRAHHASVRIRYEAAALRFGQSPEEASKVLAFITSPQGGAHLRACGLLPLHAGAAPSS